MFRREIDIVIDSSTIHLGWEHFFVVEFDESFNLSLADFLEMLIEFLARRGINRNTE
jgi:hypothetical protein